MNKNKLAYTQQKLSIFSVWYKQYEPHTCTHLAHSSTTHAESIICDVVKEMPYRKFETSTWTGVRCG